MHLDNRWAILALLFAVRLSMAFQFQSVAAISPVVMNEFGVDLAEIGLLKVSISRRGSSSRFPAARLDGGTATSRPSSLA